MRPMIFCLGCSLLFTLGCGAAGTSLHEEAQSEKIPNDKDTKKKDGAGFAEKRNLPQAPVGAEVPAKEKAQRKIIYTANLDIVVDDFDKATEQLTTLIHEQNASIASSDVRGETGMPRSGQWTIRVPADRFRDLIAELTKLGETLHNRADSEDVSEGYYDTKERLKTFEVEEKGLREYYDKHAPTAKPEDMMAVRRELTQIRSEIETMKGRLNRWDNQVEYSTVVVKMRDRKDYVPPIVPNFGGRIGQAFQGSVEALASFGRGIVLTVVALAPWLLLIAILGSPFWPRLWRAFKARKRVTVPTPAAPAAPLTPG